MKRKPASAGHPVGEFGWVLAGSSPDQAVAHQLHAAVEMFDDGTGKAVEKGAIFGMIRVGSQVDVVLPWREGMNVRVRPGDRVRAGETLLCD